MTELHFRLSGITRIKFHKRKPSKYYWVEPIAEKRIFFGLIRVGRAYPAGWVDYEFDYRSYPRPTEEILDYPWYGFDEAKNEIYNKSEIEVRLIDRSEIVHRFNTDQEAIEWIDEIIEKSEHKFAVVCR
jgi:hypothetical protein